MPITNIQYRAILTGGLEDPPVSDLELNFENCNSRQSYKEERTETTCLGAWTCNITIPRVTSDTYNDIVGRSNGELVIKAEVAGIEFDLVEALPVVDINHFVGPENRSVQIQARDYEFIFGITSYDLEDVTYYQFSDGRYSLRPTEIQYYTPGSGLIYNEENIAFVIGSVVHNISISGTSFSHEITITELGLS